jgi:aspartyl/asparaginyl beta-hydroxylase (cupin superfamily)
MGVEALVADADKAVAAGDLKGACDLLERAASERRGDPELWMKLAALRRGMRKPRPALEAVHHALEAAPRDFAALLMRASLLDSLGEASAAPAWGHALANIPDRELPPHIAAAVARGKERHEAWLNVERERMTDAMAAAERAASAEERGRMVRFRNNVLRLTRPYHSQATHFSYPELTEREFHPRRLFPWLADLEAATESIAADLRAVMAAERTELVPYIQYDDHLPLDQWKPLNRNSDWTAIHLLRNGERIDANACHCSATMHLLEALPQPQITGAGPNAMFSLLAPNTHIPPHLGVSNHRLVCHLPLVVPEGCWFRVGAQRRAWNAGEAFVFDDTIEHEAMNPSDQLRVVLIFDIWHPDLAAVERDAVKALFESGGTAFAGGL